ncbi:hypothetical protein [Amycolatopsis eburnea]|uniref:Uncharacterized protein n=1 Tax=Amycolatopsis eburnea TaxID=2267691 RepID=A0A427T210_9PSEU|nr:hypothetical protein [Amycolatopsis eburnea]RSD11763.1 hypothetical protein EIY87_33945 [Amycolatopsis eburnea]
MLHAGRRDRRDSQAGGLLQLKPAEPAEELAPLERSGQFGHARGQVRRAELLARDGHRPRAPSTMVRHWGAFVRQGEQPAQQVGVGRP